MNLDRDFIGRCVVTATAAALLLGLCSCGGGGGAGSAALTAGEGAPVVRSGATSLLVQSDDPGNAMVGQSLFAVLSLQEAPLISCVGLVTTEGVTYTSNPVPITPFRGDTGLMSVAGPSLANVADHGRNFTPVLTVLAHNTDSQLVPLYQTTFSPDTLPHLAAATYDLSFFPASTTTAYPHSVSLITAIASTLSSGTVNSFSTTIQQPLVVGPISVTTSGSGTQNLPATLFVAGSFSALSPSVGTTGVSINPTHTLGGSTSDQWLFQTTGLSDLTYSSSLGISFVVGSQTVVSGSLGISLLPNGGTLGGGIH